MPRMNLEHIMTHIFLIGNYTMRYLETVFDIHFFLTV